MGASRASAAYTRNWKTETGKRPDLPRQRGSHAQAERKRAATNVRPESTTAARVWFTLSCPRSRSQIANGVSQNLLKNSQNPGVPRAFWLL